MGHAEHTDASGLPNEGQICSEGPLFVPRVPVDRSWRVLECSEKPRGFQARKWDTRGHSSCGMSPSGSWVANDPDT